MAQANFPVQKVTYSIDEFVALTGLGRTMVFEELKSGRLQSVKCGSRRLIPASEVDAWLKALRMK